MQNNRRIGERLLSRPDRVCYAILFVILLIVLFGVECGK